MNVIRQLAKEFTERKLMGSHIEADVFVSKCKQAAHAIGSKLDRVLFLTLVMEAVTKWIENHRLGCKSTDCGFEITYGKVNYFLQQELTRLDVVLDHDAFTSSDRDAILDKLESVLNELEQIKAGQGIVAEDVEDLKDLMYLGKKKWQRQYVGTVSNWVAAGVVSEAVAKPMIEEMRSMVSQFTVLLGA